MNVLIIDNSVAFTGAIKCALSEAELLSGSHTFTFVIPAKSTLRNQLQAKGYKVHTLPMVEIKRSIGALILYLPMLLINAIRLHRILSKEHIDVVQANDFYNMLGIMVKLSGFKGKLLTYVRFLPSTQPRKLRWIWVALAKRYADKIICVSDAVLSQLPAHPKIIRIYDPVKLDEQLPKKTYADNNGPVRILYLANYIIGKGHEDAIIAFENAYRVHGNITMKCIGGDMGLEKNKEYKKYLEQCVIDRKLSDIITFAPFSTNIEEEIKNADILLNFSRGESFSMTCMEAAFYGTAVIATKCGGPEEIIANNETGMLVPFDRIAMTDAILQLANNTALRKQYALQAKEYVRTKFSTENFKAQFTAVLNEKIKHYNLTKILFLVPYPVKHAPSQRFRVELYEPYLRQAYVQYKIAGFMNEKTWNVLYKNGSALQKAAGIMIGYLKRLKHVLWDAPRYNYVFVHREAAPLGPPVFEWIITKLWRKKMIYDFDDAIWIPNTSTENKIASLIKANWKVKYICKWAYKVVGGNDYLCNYARQVNSNVVRIPTCVDMERIHNKIKIHQGAKVIVGWTGSHSTLSYLDDIMPVIRELQEEIDFTFLVIANKKPELNLRDWEFIPWNETTEVQDLLRMDIGIMPLHSDAWSEGKCGFKLIQYLSLGIPAVASPVGVNKDIIEEGINGYLCSSKEEWKERLKELISNVQLRQRMGEAGHTKMLREYSIQSQKDRFLDLFS
ncbi:MAG: glycosyltransferase [Bacteroidetes bacterium]|nr:glycosyltransferase [Bacteroidota bacterium]